MGTAENSGSPETNASEANLADADADLNACKAALEDMGHYSESNGKVDYKSEYRIFPLLQFIMTKKSIPASDPAQSVYMQDNPFFVTKNERYANSIMLATIHSKRSAVLFNEWGYTPNEVMDYYAPMRLGDNPVLPATDKGPNNGFIEVNRKTWDHELATYTAPCQKVLNLPPTKTERPILENGQHMYPFLEEIDFVTGVQGIAAGLAEDQYLYDPEEKMMQIPILIYCPNCQIDKVVMVQDGAELKFEQHGQYENWQEWFGSEWHLFTSDKINIDLETLEEGDLSKIQSNFPPFNGDHPTRVQATIDGEIVEYFNK